MKQTPFTAAILIMSDKGSRGEREDKCGAIIQPILEGAGGNVLEIAILPDNEETLRAKLLELCDERKVGAVITSGGTGISPRDITPDVTMEVIEKELPGFSEAMRACKRDEVPTSIISRAVTGIRKETLIINLPGSPKGARECLEAVIKALPHAVEKLRGSTVDCDVLLKD